MFTKSTSNSLIRGPAPPPDSFTLPSRHPFNVPPLAKRAPAALEKQPSPCATSCAASLSSTSAWLGLLAPGLHWAASGAPVGGWAAAAVAEAAAELPNEPRASQNGGRLSHRRVQGPHRPARPDRVADLESFRAGGDDRSCSRCAGARRLAGSWRGPSHRYGPAKGRRE